MRRYVAGPSVSSTTTLEDPQESLNERRIRRLRLTLHAGENENKEPKTTNSEEAKTENNVKETWQKKNGLIQRERPAGRESPQQPHRDMTNGVPEAPLQHHGSKVSSSVQRTGPERQQEVVARQWTVSHLQDEMRYIREVRDSLEKVRERMYGQFGGMQQSMQKLSQEIREANTHRRSLESEVKTRTTAMDNYDQMNSSLIAANISLQKSLLENCQSRVDRREELKSLKNTCEKAQKNLQEKEKELAAARAENQTLRLQVESSHEVRAQALQDLSAKLQQEYDKKLQAEQEKHRQEIETLQAQLDDYIMRLEEAERKIRDAEAKITEKDQRIMELERLLDCMGKEKTQLQMKLQECERRLRLLELTDTTDASVAKRSSDLQSETASLRERIKHLNDMVFCQQRKVKSMIEEVESLRAQVAQKDMFISELLDRIAIVECENNELEDKLKYFMSIQNRPQGALETREIAVGCDLPLRYATIPERLDVEPPCALPPLHLSPTHQLPSSTEPPSSAGPPSSACPPSSADPPSPPDPPSSPDSVSPTSPTPTSPVSSHPFSYLTSPIQPRTFRSNNPPPSRLGSSLLRYTPVEYSRLLLSSPSISSESKPPTSSVQPGRDEVDAETNTDRQSTPEESGAALNLMQPRSRTPQVYSPFLKLMEFTANLKID